MMLIYFQAEKAGLPKPPEPVDNTDDKLKAEQFLLQLLQAQEAAGRAKSQADTNNHCTEDQIKRLDKGLFEQLVSVLSRCFVI